MLSKATNRLEENASQIRLGNIFFDQNHRCITRDNTSFDLEPRVSELLVLLCSADATLSRDSILNILWGNAGSDEALTQAISKLRGALGDTARPHKIIETVPKHGYRLLITPERESVNSSLQNENQVNKAYEGLFSEWKSKSYLYVRVLLAIAALLLGGLYYSILQDPDNIEIEFDCSDNLSLEECLSLIEKLDQKVR